MFELVPVFAEKDYSFSNYDKRKIYHAYYKFWDAPLNKHYES